VTARSLVRRIVRPNLRFALHLQWKQLRETGLVHWARWNAVLADAWTRDRINRSAYTVLSESEVRSERRSETVFVFGSGYSLNELSAAAWDHFAAHDTLGFNAFYHERWLPVRFHLLRGGIYGELRWREFADEVAAAIRSNPLYDRTIFVMQDEYFAQFTNQMVGYRLLPAHARVFRYRTARADGPPTRTLREGLRHTTGTLADAVNFAYALGWRHIVLVGVDLYDSRYFYLKPEETLGFDPDSGRLVAAERNYWRGQRYDEPHATAGRGVVDLMAEWRETLARDGVRLSVHNPRSLLARVLPVYPSSATARSGEAAAR